MLTRTADHVWNMAEVRDEDDSWMFWLSDFWDCVTQNALNERWTEARAKASVCYYEAHIPYKQVGFCIAKSKEMREQALAAVDPAGEWGADARNWAWYGVFKRDPSDPQSSAVVQMKGSAALVHNMILHIVKHIAGLATAKLPPRTSTPRRAHQSRVTFGSEFPETQCPKALWAKFVLPRRGTNGRFSGGNNQKTDLSNASDTSIPWLYNMSEHSALVAVETYRMEKEKLEKNRLSSSAHPCKQSGASRRNTPY